MTYDNFGGESDAPARVSLPSPLRWVVAAGVSLLLAAAAFVGGWLTGKNAPTTSNWAYGQPVAPAPADWSEWKYPNATEKARMTTGNVNLGNVRVEPVTAAHLATPDPFEQVLGHYATLLSQPSLGTSSSPGNGIGGRAVKGGQECYAWVETTTTRPGVKGKVITYRTSNYALVIDVTRVDAEKHTHILISYMPNP